MTAIVSLTMGEDETETEYKQYVEADLECGHHVRWEYWPEFVVTGAPLEADVDCPKCPRPAQASSAASDGPTEVSQN